MSVASSYAKALFEAAAETHPTAGDTNQFLSELEQQMGAFVAMVDSSKEAQVALHTPITSTKEKVTVVETLSPKLGLSTLLTRFLVLLAEKNRLSALRKIRDAFSEVRLAAEGGVSGRLVGAEPLRPDDVESLARAFSKKIGKRVAFQVSVDSNLLAGIKVTVNGVTYDGTLRSQLQRLRDQFVLGSPTEKSSH